MPTDWAASGLEMIVSTDPRRISESTQTAQASIRRIAIDAHSEGATSIQPSGARWSPRPSLRRARGRRADAFPRYGGDVQARSRLRLCGYARLPPARDALHGSAGHTDPSIGALQGGSVSHLLRPVPAGVTGLPYPAWLFLSRAGSKSADGDSIGAPRKDQPVLDASSKNHHDKTGGVQAADDAPPNGRIDARMSL